MTTGRGAGPGTLALVALVALGGARAEARPRVAYRDDASKAARARPAEPCRDPIAGTWRAKVWRPESSVWDRVTLSVKRQGSQLSGWIVVESWDGDEDQATPPRCDDGTPAIETWRQRLGGRLEDGVVDITGSRVRKLTGACEPPDDATTYRPDHFRGELVPGAELLITTNNDGGVDDDRPHHFERISCRARP